MTTATTTRKAAQPPSTKSWTIDDVRNLGATTDIETAGAILGIGRSKSYELAKSGGFPSGCYASAAGTIRSAGAKRGRATCRRSTAS